MNAQRKRKLRLWLFILAVISSTSLLILFSLSQNISLFYTPSQIVLQKPEPGKQIRLGGMVVEGSVKHLDEGAFLEFELTDFKTKVLVRYKGSLPDLFKEGQGIVALGTVDKDLHFRAQEVLAKHDENYMPKEVKDALVNKEPKLNLQAKTSVLTTKSLTRGHHDS